MTHTITTYVQYLYPGAFYPEYYTRAVETRDPERVAREADGSVFAFEFYDLVTATVTVGGQEVGLSSKPVGKSALYYIDAVEMTCADVAALPGDHSILLSNMRCNGWECMLRCRTGNFRPKEPGDIVIGSGGRP